jgi:hypothetical protein
MSAVQRIALASLLFGLQVADAFADGPPKLDVTTTCNGAIRFAGREIQACLGDERAAQSTIANNWSKYRANDKSLCVGLQYTGRAPSYIELLSCLETRRNAKDSREDDSREIDAIMVETDQSKQLTSRPTKYGEDGLPLTEEPPPPDPPVRQQAEVSDPRRDSALPWSCSVWPISWPPCRAR